MLTILRRRVFVNELLDIAEHLGQDNLEAGQRFIDACEETFAELARMQSLGSARTFDHPDLQNVRMWHIKGYDKYLIFYQPTKSCTSFTPHETTRLCLKENRYAPTAS